MGSNECKIGITKHPLVRLGSYQNSYSRKSHVACFDVVYIGPDNAINRLETAVKQRYNWKIERDGRGSSEWVSLNFLEVEQEISKIIDGYGFQVKKVPKKYLPLTVDNFDKFLASQK